MASILATNLLAFVIVLGFLVFAHESGHFLFAKLFGVRVYVFSFGFGKRLFGFRRGDTDYRVSLVPLGGYVRMAGESPEEESEGGEGEFLSKPKWQRFLILFAGPGVNVLIAIAFLTWLNMVGLEVLADQRVIAGKVSGKPAIAAGIQRGDIITAADGEKINSFEDLKMIISMNPQKPVQIELLRNGKPIQTTLTPERVETRYGIVGQAGISQYITNEVSRVEPKTAAARAGIRPGDRIVSAAGQPVREWNEFIEVLVKYRGNVVPMEVQRGSERVKVTLPAMRSEQERYPGAIPPTRLRKLNFSAALDESIDQNLKMVQYTFATLARLFRFQGSVKDFSGPLTIASVSGEMLRAGWKELIILMASISLQLGIMNLLPIPVLDGGHIMILAVESVAGRELSLLTKERITKVGFAVIASLMIFVLCNDVIQHVLALKKP
jgi:regulator of sigma E protease